MIILTTIAAHLLTALPTTAHEESWAILLSRIFVISLDIKLIVGYLGFGKAINDLSTSHYNNFHTLRRLCYPSTLDCLDTN